MKTLHWGNRASAKPEIRAAGSLDKVGRTARAINWRVCHDRSKRDTTAREKHLREIMGLPATPSQEIDQ
jgi:hypothetical protein